MLQKIIRRLPWFALFGCSIFILLMALLSEVSDGGADAIVHHRMAKFAFKHPWLFLDLWGKPAFTALSAPFASFGFTAHKIFNVIVGAITLLITWKTAKTFWLTPAWFSILFLCFSPVWLTLSFSTMTEPLVALIIVAGVYFFIRERYMLSAIIISFAPFARQEGYAYILLFLLALLLRKQFMATIFLFTGFLLMSVIGFFALDDFLWVIHRHPYGANLPSDGGPFLHYFSQSELLFGLVGAILLFLGTVCAFFHRGNKKMELILLVLGGFWLLFMAHTLIYWLGIVPGNIGLIRVIACVAPLGAILMLAGLERILLWIRRGGVRLIVGILVLALNASMNINGLEIPLKKGQLEKTHDNLGEWYRNLDHTGMKTWTSDPQLWYYCGVDVYDQKIWAEVFYEPHALDYMKEGDLLIWDGQFGDHHQNVKFETFMENPGLKLLHIQVPEDPSLTGDRFFRIYVFRRTMDSISAEDNYSTEAALLGDTCLRVRYINLKGSNGKFVCIDLTEDGRVVCDRTEAKEWERIACKIINDSIVNLVGVGGRVLNTPEDSPGQSVWGQNAGTTGMPEFKMRKTGENKVELITPAGNYWCIDPGTGNIMLCNQSSANSVFTMEEAK